MPPSKICAIALPSSFVGNWLPKSEPNQSTLSRRPLNKLPRRLLPSSIDDVTAVVGCVVVIVVVVKLSVWLILTNFESTGFAISSI